LYTARHNPLYLPEGGPDRNIEPAVSTTPGIQRLVFIKNSKPRRKKSGNIQVFEDRVTKNGYYWRDSMPEIFLELSYTSQTHK
jgi:hypothetical protein